MKPTVAEAEGTLWQMSEQLWPESPPTLLSHLHTRGLCFPSPWLTQPPVPMEIHPLLPGVLGLVSLSHPSAGLVRWVSGVVGRGRL